MFFTEAIFSDNKTTRHGSWSCFSPATETEKQRQEPASQPLPFLEIRCSHNFSISTSHYCQAKFASKIGWSLPYSLNYSRALKLHLDRQPDSPISIAVFPFILFDQSSFLYCTGSQYLKAPKPRWESDSALSRSSLPPCSSCVERLWLSKPHLPIPASFIEKA